MAILRYEERVRIERANGLRKPDQCVEGGCGCSVYGSDEAYKGKSFSDIAATPLRQNAVCPHPKMVVPVTGAFVVEEPVKVFKPEYKDPAYQLVDGNPCDGRLVGVVETISDSDRSTVTVKQAHTVVTHDVKVEDTAFDEPNERPVVTSTIKADAEATQPVAVNGTEAEEVPLSEVSDGENSGRKPRGKKADKKPAAAEAAEKPADKPVAETPAAPAPAEGNDAVGNQGNGDHL
jgi:hypothetical protein|nr:MAG TPA: hypothetical protein [Caudoviricetes sp.]